MLSYQTIMATDLSKLTAAADQWSKMAGEFKKLEDAYKQDVHGVSLGPNWQGISSLVANRSFDDTLKEYQGAQTEAKAIAELLRDAYKQFVDCKKKVEAARDRAIEAGMKVSAEGICTFDWEKATEATRTALRHDPRAAQETATHWTNHIKQATKIMADADDGVRIAFERVVDAKDDPTDTVRNGFNRSAQGDIEKYEAQEMKEIATRINSGEATAQDLKMAERSLRDNSDNKAYSQTLLKSLGPDAMLQLTSKMNDLAHYEDKENKKSYLRIQSGLADVMGTATRVPGFGKDGNPLPAGSKEKPLRVGSKEYVAAVEKWKSSKSGAFYKDWVSGLEEIGTKKYETEAVNHISLKEGADQARGYQILVSMMQQGGDYSPEFLHDITDGIRKAEDPKQGGDPDIWDLDHKYDSENPAKTDGWFANDPLDGALGIMSKDPAAATAYFDPASYHFDDESDAIKKQGNDNLRYLQSERDWDLINEYKYTHKDNMPFATGDALDADSHVGFGAALEAATSGNAPGTEAPEGFRRHTAAETRVFEQVVSSYAEISSVDKSAIPENIRQNLGNAVAYYPSDVYDILGEKLDFGPNGPGTSEPNDVDVNRQQMIQFIRGVSEDGGAFRTIHDSQMGQISEGIYGLDKHDFTSGSPAAEGVAQKSGKTMGAMDSIRADVLGSQRDAEIDRNNWNKVYKYHTIGVPLTAIPEVGDTLQRLLDISTGKEAEKLNNAATDKTTGELIREYTTNGYPRLERMLGQQAEESGVTPTEMNQQESAFQRIIATAAQNDYSSAIHDAEGSTGKRS